MRFAITAVLAVALSGCQPEVSYHRWEPIEFSFRGPESQSLGKSNPFQIRVDVVFRSPDGREFRVPGFFDGDGRGNPDGNVWKVRFSADQNGAWTYKTESRHEMLHGIEGSAKIADPRPEAPPLYRAGRLEYVGMPYLKFREGGYWLKAGADEPENILGAAFGDWDSKKKQIDYLAEKGINSIYVMTHTLEGDENDVWPWIGSTPEEAKQNSSRFDIPKLARWREFFEYVQRKGIVLYLILEDDSAWTGFDREAYYREIVARFGDLPAVYFNSGEEANENYSLRESLQHMTLLAEIDPFDHPRAVHNVQSPVAQYVDSPVLDMTSIQTWPTSAARLNQLAIAWHEACLVRGQRRLVVNFDEARPADDRRNVWAVYLAGGMWEPIVPAPRGYAALEPLWTELVAAKTFMESLPFERMFPANHLVRNGQAFCFAKPGEVYALYLPEGGATELLVEAGDYSVEWFNPRTGEFDGPPKSASGPRLLLEPPNDLDWAVRLAALQPAPAAPVAASARVQSLGGEALKLRLALWDHDAPDSYRTEIVTPPRHGTLSGEGRDRGYSPNPGFSGQDRFEWRALGDGWESNLATVLIYANVDGENQPPRVTDQRVNVAPGGSALISLFYSDQDGPGPHIWLIREPPKYGRLAGRDNDVTYIPDDGFAGTDAFTWVVADGLNRSNTARVTITVR